MSSDKAVLEEILFNNLVMEWNRKINLVSRKKTDVFDLVEDSKLYLDYIDFFDGIRILDLGTGGGFPGIPIRIYHPEARLTLVDSVKKKSDAAADILDKMGFTNAEVVWSRAEDLQKHDKYKSQFDYVVARSVAPLFNLTKWSRGLLKPAGKVIALKGEDIADEILKTKRQEFVKKIETFNADDRVMIIAELI